MDFSISSINKNSFIFLEKAFLIFRETETPPPPQKKRNLVFQETELFYVLRNGNPKGSNFLSSKNKKNPL